MFHSKKNPAPAPKAASNTPPPLDLHAPPPCGPKPIGSASGPLQSLEHEPLDHAPPPCSPEPSAAPPKTTTPYEHELHNPALYGKNANPLFYPLAVMPKQ